MCVPSSSAVPLEFDENGVCSGCNTAKERYEMIGVVEALKQILDEYKNLMDMTVLSLSAEEKIVIFKPI